MNLRKQRVIQSGLTNVDFKTKGDTQAVEKYQPNMKYADVGTMSKGGFKAMAGTFTTDPKEKMKLNSGWETAQLPDPKVETAVQFYNAQGKKPKAPVLVANKKLQELEATQWTDKIFTGDNPKTTATLSAEAGKRDLAANPKKRRVVAESVTKAIEDRLARTSAQSREAVMTLDKVVDEKHVMDIRRALRRKYASRTNLHRIFGQWDRDNKGGISAADLYLGLNKIGITASLDQASALHALATQTDNDPNLSLQEFSDLLFKSDELYNAESVKKLQPAEKSIEVDLMQTMKDQQANRTIDMNALEPEIREKVEIKNKWKAAIQRNLQNITKDLLVVDTEKTYQADPKELMRVLDRRLHTTTAMQDQKEELHEYLMQFIDDSNGKINYTDMALDLRSFNYDKETNLGILPRSSRSISSGRYSYFGSMVQKNVFNDDFTVLDSQSVPANKLDLIEKHLIRVNRHLQDKFKTQENLTNFLKEKIDVDKNGNIDVDEMKSLIKETCQEEVLKRRLSKQDLEGFLSAFKYNMHGATDLNSIAPIVFEKDTNKLALAISNRVRTNPPPMFVN